MDDRLTLRLSPGDLAALDSLRGATARGPYLRELLRGAAASSGSPAPLSPEQEHLERLRVISTTG